MFKSGWSLANYVDSWLLLDFQDYSSILMFYERSCSLCCLVQVSPVKRITIQAIMEHDWFNQDLPEDLFPPLGEMNTTQIDSSVVAEVCQKLKVSSTNVLEALRFASMHHALFRSCTCMYSAYKV